MGSSKDIPLNEASNSVFPEHNITHHSKENSQSTSISGVAHGTSNHNAAINHFKDQMIVIHVCDENKKANKDFKCDRTLLLNNMKYFEKYLADSKNIDDIDISVHCDINIFDWLMRFVHKKEPKLEVKNSVSILISSDFL